MVFLHAMEGGAPPPRVSTDLDVLVNARVVTGGVREFVAAIEAHGFVFAGVSPEGIAHGYRRGGVSVDVLAPEGLGSISPRRRRVGRCRFLAGPKHSIGVSWCRSCLATIRGLCPGLCFWVSSSARQSRSMSMMCPTRSDLISPCC